MTPSSEAYSSALNHYRSGAFAQAEQGCRQLLQLDPFHGGALHLLGILAYQQGRNEEAIGFLRKAAVALPGDAGVHSNLGLAYQGLGKTEDAVAQYREAVRLKPDHAEAYYNLGIALALQQKHAEAIAAYQEAIRVRPDYAEAHSNLGNVFWRNRASTRRSPAIAKREAEADPG